MPNYIRPKISGATNFFTVALANRSSDLLVHEVGHLRQAVRATKHAYPFEIEAWVVLPDHLHCIWRLPVGDCDFSTRWRLIKSRFSRQLAKGSLREGHKRRAERGVWQRRFWDRHLRCEAEFDAHLQYCWHNPVKHGLVARPADWAYSSVHRDPRYVGGTKGA